jgi:hypothetical protein
MTRWSTRFSWIAIGLAAGAAAAGLLTGVYRDVPPMVDQAHAADLATLFIAAPLLAAALVRGAHVIAAAGLAYLAYTYAIFSFEVVLNPLAPVYIAVLSLSLWAFVLGNRDLASATDGASLPRRTTAAFLGIMAVLFAVLWLSDIAGSITSGVLPPSVADLNVPTSAVYALDLGFVLPLFGLAGVLLVRRAPDGAPLAFGSLVFLVLMALSILPMFVIQAARGERVDIVVPLVFVAIAGAVAVLASIGLVGGPSISAHKRQLRSMGVARRPLANRSGRKAVL